eukprot:scaffold2757_cov30-Tisochrysis_lutea.AAC.1
MGSTRGPRPLPFALGRGTILDFGAASVYSQYLGIPYIMWLTTDLVAGASFDTFSSILSASFDENGLSASGAPSGTPKITAIESDEKERASRGARRERRERGRELWPRQKRDSLTLAAWAAALEWAASHAARPPTTHSA